MSKRKARKLVMPPITLPNMMPTRGTMTGSFMGIRRMNQTKIQVPMIAAAKANAARDQIVESGMKRSAMRIPNCADEIVAPVVGETNLFAQSCCMMRPAMLMPAPVQRIARSLGKREIRRSSRLSASPERRDVNDTSAAPTRSDRRPTRSVSVRRMAVDLGMKVRKTMSGNPSDMVLFRRILHKYCERELTKITIDYK